MPNDDNSVDSIQVISDGISAINFRLADTLPTAPGYNDLEKERDAALERFHLLIKIFIANSTNRFIQSDSQLAVVNSEMKEILQDLQDLQDTIDTVRRFVSAIDSLIGSIGQIV